MFLNTFALIDLIIDIVKVTFNRKQEYSDARVEQNPLSEYASYRNFTNY